MVMTTKCVVLKLVSHRNAYIIVSSLSICGNLLQIITFVCQYKVWTPTEFPDLLDLV
jgi:hypothetical protein